MSLRWFVAIGVAGVVALERSCAADTPAAASGLARDSALLQHGARVARISAATNATVERHEWKRENNLQLFSWTTGPYSDCYRNGKGNLDKGRWFREVTCKDFISGHDVVNTSCKGRPKPAEWDTCFCSYVACMAHSAMAQVAPEHVSRRAFLDALAASDKDSEDDYEFIGCFPLDDDDDEPGLDSELYDFKCLHYDEPGQCRSGLPFYRFISNSQTPSVCYEFCIGKGFDVFGLVAAQECRCGASRLNEDAWHEGTPKEHLLPAWDKMLPEDGESPCEVRVYRYKGHFESGGVPSMLTSISMPDLKYFESLAVGKLLTKGLEDMDGSTDGPDAPLRRSQEPAMLQQGKDAEEDLAELFETEDDADEGDVEDADEDEAANVSLVERKSRRRFVKKAKKKKKKDNSQAGFARKCDQIPGTNGCTGAKRWNLFPTSTPPRGLGGNIKKFPVYYRVPYVFDTTHPPGHKFHVDQKRKEAFREAAKVWREQTCIHWLEFAKPPSKKSPWKAFYVSILVEDLESCYASHGVKTKMKLKSYVNLGWCCSMTEIGNMVHEIGHVMGMDHEHSRPDGLEKYHGHGPYWKLAGGAMDDPSQWALSKDAYTGSANDGPGDKIKGYESYDFESIMHYPLDDPWGKVGDTLIPKGIGKSTGQRKHLSKGDLTQVLDMYQCNRPNKRAVKSAGKGKKNGGRKRKRARKSKGKQRRRRR